MLKPVTYASRTTSFKHYNLRCLNKVREEKTPSNFFSKEPQHENYGEHYLNPLTHLHKTNEIKEAMERPFFHQGLTCDIDDHCIFKHLMLDH